MPGLPSEAKLVITAIAILLYSMGIWSVAHHWDEASTEKKEIARQNAMIKQQEASDQVSQKVDTAHEQAINAINSFYDKLLGTPDLHVQSLPTSTCQPAAGSQGNELIRRAKKLAIYKQLDQQAQDLKDLQDWTRQQAALPCK